MHGMRHQGILQGAQARQFETLIKIMLYRFPDPFRYIPHPLVKEAAGQVLAMLESWREQPDGSPHRELERSFAEGKMLGVLVVSSNSSDTTDSLFSPGSISELPIGTSRGVPTDTVRGVRFIAAFSGTVRGADGSAIATVNGFVPPIIDLTDPDGYFKKEEARISILFSAVTPEPRMVPDTWPALINVC